MIKSDKTSMREEIKDNMRIMWQVPIEMKDGIVLRADVFMPVAEGKYPVIMSYGPYAKGQSFQEAYSGPWNVMVDDFPDIMKDSTNKYQNWETADPEKWVPYGYALVRIDSRGAGCSPGVQEFFSKQEIEDFYDCIEWGGSQDWSNGNVGLLGISYYAANQWKVASMQPPSLKAIIPWEGTSDWYRELYYHGGIRSIFVDKWAPRQLPMQYGYGERGRKNPNTGEWAAGQVTLSDEDLEKNRIDLPEKVKQHKLYDEYHQELKVDWDKVTVPILTAANWGGAGLHLRGNVEGFVRAASEQKWLEVHGYEHWTHFYTPYGVELQRRFFDYFLKNDDNGWDKEPRVQLHIRHINNKFKMRTADSWPIKETDWTKCYLDAEERVLSTNAPKDKKTVTYKPLEEEVTFYLPKSEKEVEITGPVAAKLYISSKTEDADLFLTLRLFDPDNNEVSFRGAMDANAPVAQGWLRASRRKLDADLTLPYRPYHTHDEDQPLTPGEVYELDIEIWPTSIVIPPNYQLALTVSGKDYEFSGEITEESKKYHRYPSKGCGPFLHNDEEDRPKEIYGGDVTIHTGGEHQSYLLLPFIPEN